MAKIHLTPYGKNFNQKSDAVPVAAKIVTREAVKPQEPPKHFSETADVKVQSSGSSVALKSELEIPLNS